MNLNFPTLFCSTFPCSEDKRAGNSKFFLSFFTLFFDIPCKIWDTQQTKLEKWSADTLKDNKIPKMKSAKKSCTFYIEKGPVHAAGYIEK